MPPFNEIYEANNLETIGTNIRFFYYIRIVKNNGVEAVMFKDYSPYGYVGSTLHIRMGFFYAKNE